MRRLTHLTTSVLRPVGALLLTTALLPATAALGQGDDSRSPTSQAGPEATGEPRWETGVELHGLAFDNFFQFADGQPQPDVNALRLEGRFGYRLLTDRSLTLYGRGGLTSYSDDLDDSTLIGAGLRWDGDGHGLDVGLTSQQDRPSFDVGDTFDRADVRRLAAEYSYRLDEAWELTALGELEDQEYESGSGRDNDFTNFGGAVRYRGWGYDLSPEIGFESGSRDANDANEDHDQRDLWLKLRSVPVRPLYVSLRLRLRERDYDIADPQASNFGREDERRQIALGADWSFTDHLTGLLYYTWEDADSTKDSRDFTTQLLSLGVRWAM